MGAERPVGRGRAQLIERLRDQDSNIAPGVPAWGSVTYGIQVREESTNPEPGNVKSYLVQL